VPATTLTQDLFHDANGYTLLIGCAKNVKVLRKLKG
jgi:hypothetical protein